MGLLGSGAERQGGVVGGEPGGGDLACLVAAAVFEDGLHEPAIGLVVAMNGDETGLRSPGPSAVRLVRRGRAAAADGTGL